MNSKVNLLILAGGLGSRYNGSKQIDSVGVQEAYLLEFAIYDAVKAGFSKVILVVNSMVLADMQKKLAHWSHHIVLSFVLQELHADDKKKVNVKRIKPWGTAQAVCRAKKEINGPFVVMNADDYYGQGVMSQAITFFRDEQIAQGLISYPLVLTLSPNGGVSRGICSVESGFLRSIEEHHHLTLEDGERSSIKQKKFDQNTLVSMNLWLFQVSILDHLELYFQHFFAQNYSDLTAECYLPSAIQEGIETNKFRVIVLESKDRWVGLTFQEDHSMVEEYLNSLTLARSYPSTFPHE